MLGTLAGIIFPDLCVGCNGVLMSGEQMLCTYCLRDLPETNFHLQEENDLEKIFWGRVRLVRAFSFLVFRKQGIVQHILHELKYGNNPELGVMLGRIYGARLRESGQNYDAIAAIPLHKSKLRQRGYNQSECFAKGLSEAMNCIHHENLILRKRATATQTKKNRFDRWVNVEEVFEVNDPELLEGKHLLLVDDVITTGATIEACAASLIPYAGRLSVGSVACVVNQ